MKIPSNRQWTQDNSGDTLGILGDSSNMSFDKAGKATLSKKAVAIMSTENNADLRYPIAFVYFVNKYHVLTSNSIFTGELDGSVWVKETDFTPTVGLNSDAILYNDLMIVTENTSFSSWDGANADTYSLGVLTADVPHPLEVFGNLLVIGNGNEVITYNSSYVVQQTLVLPSNYEVTSLRVVNNYIYIGTRNKYGGNANIFTWNGDSTLYDYSCDVGASWVFSMTPYLSTVVAVTSQGQLGIVNGTTFEELASFPVYNEPHARWQGSGGLQFNGKVFNRGMCTVGDSIYINIEGDIDVGFLPKMKGGVWVYEPTVGLYHRSFSSSSRMIRDAGLTLSDNTITTTFSHNLKTGDGVSFSSLSGISGVSINVVYFVTVISDTEIKLSQTRKAVQNQRYIELSGTPDSLDILLYCYNNEFGTAGATSGAIMPTVYNETPNALISSEVIWGSRTNLLDGTANYVVNTFADMYNIGSFTTQRIYTDNIEQNWKEIYNFIDGITVDTEQVIVKVQTKHEPTPPLLEGVWLDERTINSNLSTDYTAWLDMSEGDEIIVRDGYGRGRSAHIASNGINASSSTVSITLDEDIGLANQTCEVYYTNFKKVGNPLTVDVKTKEKVRSVVDNTSSAWVAVKIELRGYQPAVNMMELSNSVQKNPN